MEFLYPFDLLGTYFFAISGTLAGINKKLDMFGALVVGFITAIGGGSIRDLVLGQAPLIWVRDMNYAIVIILAFLSTMLFRKHLLKLRKTFFVFDTIGIGLFTVMGLEKSLALDTPLIVAVFMGVTSAVMGGVIRDIICNDIPLIFRTELYATACLAGAVVFLIVNQFVDIPYIAASSGFITIVSIRWIAIKRKWRLPIVLRN